MEASGASVGEPGTPICPHDNHLVRIMTRWTHIKRQPRLPRGKLRVADSHKASGGQFFPRYVYARSNSGTLFDLTGDGINGTHRADNITDTAQAEYRAAYGQDVSKDDIFYYIYGLLHSPEYRTRFAADLKPLI